MIRQIPTYIGAQVAKPLFHLTPWLPLPQHLPLASDRVRKFRYASTPTWTTPGFSPKSFLQLFLELPYAGPWAWLFISRHSEGHPFLKAWCLIGAGLVLASSCWRESYPFTLHQVLRKRGWVNHGFNSRWVCSAVREKEPWSTWQVLNGYDTGRLRQGRSVMWSGVMWLWIASDLVTLESSVTDRQECRDEFGWS